MSNIVAYSNLTSMENRITFDVKKIIIKVYYSLLQSHLAAQISTASHVEIFRKFLTNHIWRGALLKKQTGLYIL